MKIVLHETVDKDILSNSPDVFYIIEDTELDLNLKHISDNFNLENVYSIRTKKNSNRKISAFYEDKNFESIKNDILFNILEIKYKSNKYNTISLSSNGYGTYMEKYCPLIYNYLSDLLYHNFSYDNKIKNCVKKIPSYSDINKAKILDISYYNSIKLELIKNKKSISLLTEQNFKLGDLIKLKHEKSQEEFICKVNIPCYDKSIIGSNYLNLFEGYTKPNNDMNLQFHIEYIGSIKNGTIVFSEPSINKVDNEPSQKLDTVNKTIEVVKPENKTENIKPNWFKNKTEDLLNNFLKTITDDKNPSILELNSNDYLILTDTYLFEISYRSGKFKILNKIKTIEYHLTNIFDTNYLFLKKDIYGEKKISILKIDNIEFDIIENFMKSKNTNG
jgi:hypothetical protein